MPARARDTLDLFDASAERCVASRVLIETSEALIAGSREAIRSSKEALGQASSVRPIVSAICAPTR